MQDSTLNYLIELRKRLIKSACFAVCLFVPLFFYANDIFLLLAKPLLQHIKGPMIAINITDPLLVPIELATKLACLASLPFLIYQLWSFITPALYAHEGNLLRRLYTSSVLLFLAGILFCYFVALPLLFGFFCQATSENVKLMPDISYYLSLSSRFFVLFGMTFQIPVVIYFLIKCELVTKAQFKTARPYFIVGAFTIGMLLTPPDVLSQVLLALPMCLLFELGLLFSPTNALSTAPTQTTETSTY